MSEKSKGILIYILALALACLFSFYYEDMPLVIVLVTAMSLAVAHGFVEEHKLNGLGDEVKCLSDERFEEDMILISKKNELESRTGDLSDQDKATLQWVLDRQRVLQDFDYKLFRARCKDGLPHYPRIKHPQWYEEYRDIEKNET